MATPQHRKVIGMLPEDARQILMRAAATRIPPNQPLARALAVDEAMEKVRRMYPKLFKKE